jgi:exodeoxyribonuclease V alpha subunit
VGKTTVIRAILRTFEMSGMKVSLAAPTGRAAKRLKESTGRTAMTIHRLLKYDPTTGSFVYNHKRRLAADVVILDEVSMVDIVLMGHMVSATGTGASFIMVGDRDQLPSVGPGSVLADIIRSQSVAVSSLTRIFRQARFSKIIQTAHNIRIGHMPVHHPESDCVWIACDDSASMLQALSKLYQDGSLHGWNPISDVQVLTAMHRGQVGTKHLNQMLKNLLNPSEGHYAVGDKVIQLRNNYDKEVYNGDVGIIETVSDEGIKVMMDDGRLVHYLDDETNDIQLAYATTIHKSQGSEYPVVIVMIATEQFVLLNRHLLYTAVTRARKKLILIAIPKAVALGIKNDDPGLRMTQLTQALSDVSMSHQA